jgi:hypothetical protein
VFSALCIYGCNRPAVKELKNGRLVCAASPNQCPVLRAKNKEANKGRIPFAGRPHPRGMAGKTAWNKGRKLEDCYDPATAERLRESSRQAVRKMHARRTPDSESELRRREKLSAVARERRLDSTGLGRGAAGKAATRAPGATAVMSWRL